MPKYFLYLLLLSIFIIIMVLAMPKKDIIRLSIYGIMFGGLMDILMLTFGQITGLYEWINFGPLGYKYIPLPAPITWGVFFIIYFYFLPKQKPFNYIYVLASILFSSIYINMVTNLGIFKCRYSPFIVGLFAFTFWFSLVTWGYYRLTSYFQKHQDDNVDS